MSELCAHCGREAQGYATRNGERLCHPDVGTDCYRLVTVYGHSTPHLDCHWPDFVDAFIKLRETLIREFEDVDTRKQRQAGKDL